MGGRHLSKGVVLDRGHEAGLCWILYHASQDSSGPDGGRPEELRDHLEWRVVEVDGGL